MPELPTEHVQTSADQGQQKLWKAKSPDWQLGAAVLGSNSVHCKVRLGRTGAFWLVTLSPFSFCPRFFFFFF